MIDIHSHILHGVDDGCKTIDESIEMIKGLINIGVTDIVLTPHFSYQRKFLISYKEVEKRFKDLKIEVSKQKLKINLFLGSEIDENRNILNIIYSGMCHSMNYSKYVLIDFTTNKSDVDDICYELILNGYKPIIAHPERYLYNDGIELIKQWKDTGALIQMDASSLLLTKKTKKLSKALLKNNVVDIVSSDVHTSPKTIGYLKKAFLYVTKKYGKEEAKRLFVTNPSKIIRN